MKSLAYGNTLTWLSPSVSGGASSFSGWLAVSLLLLLPCRLPCLDLGFPPAGSGSVQSTRLRASSSTVVAPWNISATLRRLSQGGIRAWRVAWGTLISTALSPTKTLCHFLIARGCVLASTTQASPPGMAKNV